MPACAAVRAVLSDILIDNNMARMHLSYEHFFAFGLASPADMARHAVILDVLHRIFCKAKHAGRSQVPVQIEIARARLRANCSHNAKTQRFMQAEFRWPHKRQRCTDGDTINRDNG